MGPNELSEDRSGYFPTRHCSRREGERPKLVCRAQTRCARVRGLVEDALRVTWGLGIESTEPPPRAPVGLWAVLVGWFWYLRRVREAEGVSSCRLCADS